ncbi:MAG: hypothetical protein J5960_07360, partial [Desulfovibrio sp.]|nr:hypothetical protein [Desulfovibrio sp.]
MASRRLPFPAPGRPAARRIAPFPDLLLEAGERARAEEWKEKRADAGRADALRPPVGQAAEDDTATAAQAIASPPADAPAQPLFVPMSAQELRTLGWDGLDVLLINGDAYVD